MVKKCIICDEPATFCIKDSSECYCTMCAKENFNDLSYLLRVEEQARKVKELIKNQLKDNQ